MSEAWWNELKHMNQRDMDLNWCCKLVKYQDLEHHVQTYIAYPLSIRLKVQFCPQCGTQLVESIISTEFNCCLFIYNEIPIDGIQYERLDSFGNWIVDKILINYCFMCGKHLNPIREKLKEISYHILTSNDTSCLECKHPKHMLPPPMKQPSSQSLCATCEYLRSSGEDILPSCNLECLRSI